MDGISKCDHFDQFFVAVCYICCSTDKVNCSIVTLGKTLLRDYEVRERIPVPHDNYFQSFFSSRHAILENYNPQLNLKLNDVTITDQ